MMIETALIQRIIVWTLPVVFAITVHEVAHGWVAKKFGDNTASDQGRLTLNPLKHIDILGTVIVPGLLLMTLTGFVFGWAKPVPVDLRNFKKPNKYMAIVAVAGPVSNLLMAIIWTLIIRLALSIDLEFVAKPLYEMGKAGIHINLILALINLIPIPPLDGSRIVTGVLPNKWAWQYNRFEGFGFVFLLILLLTGVLNSILGYPMYFTEQLFFTLAGI